MSRYPEHDKLSEVKVASQAIGEFLDFGLPRLAEGMAIYERIIRDCECSACDQRKAAHSTWHTKDEKATIVKGRVQVTDWQPTHRTIQWMLAKWFGIDQAKIDAEKEAMLDALRAAA